MTIQNNPIATNVAQTLTSTPSVDDYFKYPITNVPFLSYEPITTIRPGTFFWAPVAYKNTNTNHVTFEMRKYFTTALLTTPTANQFQCVQISTKQAPYRMLRETDVPHNAVDNNESEYIQPCRISTFNFNDAPSHLLISHELDNVNEIQDLIDKTIERNHQLVHQFDQCTTSPKYIPDSEFAHNHEYLVLNHNLTNIVAVSNRMQQQYPTIMDSINAAYNNNYDPILLTPDTLIASDLIVNEYGTNIQPQQVATALIVAKSSQSSIMDLILNNQYNDIQNELLSNQLLSF